MKKTVYFLLFMATLLAIYACKEDDGFVKPDSHEKSHHGYKRTLISFEEMKSRLGTNNGSILTLFRNIANKGGDDYIQSIDSSYIIQYSNDTLTTYTLRVSTLDDENYKFSNLIIRTIDGETEEFIAHYSPTDEWQELHNNGEYVPFDGEFSLRNTKGEDMNNEEVQGKTTITCRYSIEPIFDPDGCSCGGGTVIGYEWVLSCHSSNDGSPNSNGGNGNSGGGSGGSGGSNSGGGGSEGGSGSGNGDLPTDPNDWALLRLENAIEDNPFLLLDIPCEQFDKWVDVIDYNFPTEVHQRIAELNTLENNCFGDCYDLQIMEFAAGPKVNMDFFPITITEFPINPMTGSAFTPAGFFDLMRKSLDAFLAGGPADFKPYDGNEYTKWVSNNYLTSLMRFEIDVNEWMSQNGSVITVEKHPQRWKFATIDTPQDWDHPVSGIREFGYYQVPGTSSYVYYTRGVDRVEKSLTTLVERLDVFPSAFEGADRLWNKFQENMVNFVNDFGGEAVENTDYIARPDWEQLRKVLYQGAPVSSLPGFDNPCE